MAEGDAARSRMSRRPESPPTGSASSSSRLSAATLGLDLTRALAGHPQHLADLLQRPRAPAREPEAHLDHLALPLGQRVQRAAHVLAPQVLRGDLEGRLGGLVFDEVAQLGGLLT